MVRFVPGLTYQDPLPPTLQVQKHKQWNVVRYRGTLLQPR